ncbi:MAG: hypothetical protein IKZ41_10115, partial [Clostridia bacterium]|nr:hypothetical protein [Clostridia bacterium]
SACLPEHRREDIRILFKALHNKEFRAFSPIGSVCGITLRNEKSYACAPDIACSFMLFGRVEASIILV